MKDALSLCENDEQESREVGRKDALLLREGNAGQAEGLTRKGLRWRISGTRREKEWERDNV